MPRQRADNFPRGVRNHLLRASGGRCQECGSAGKLEVDHIIPVAQGGRPEATNGQVLCWVCHRHKSNRERGYVFVPGRCRYHTDRRCPNTAALLMSSFQPPKVFAPRYQRYWRPLCQHHATHLLEYWAGEHGWASSYRYHRSLIGEGPIPMSWHWPTFQPLSGGSVAWQVGTYEPDHWYAAVWDNLCGQWSLHPTLGLFQTAREAEQAGQQMATEQAAALDRLSDT